MRKIAIALASIVVAGLLWSQPAEARCWWNGYRTVCTHHRHHWYGYHYYRPYYYGYYGPYYRPYICTPWPLCWG